MCPQDVFRFPGSGFDAHSKTARVSAPAFQAPGKSQHQQSVTALPQQSHMFAFIGTVQISPALQAVNVAFLRATNTPSVSRRRWRRQFRCCASHNGRQKGAAIGDGDSPSLTNAPLGETSVPDLVRDFLTRVEEGNPLEGLRRADAAYANLRAKRPTIGRDGARKSSKDIVQVHPSSSEPQALHAGHEFDVIIAGGTLGVFIALALQMKHWRCAIIEQGAIMGREQEWNISRSELATLLEMRLLTQDELESVIVSEWNPSRIAFATTKDADLSEIFVENVLNCGVSPRALVRLFREKFERLGGICLEFSKIDEIDVYDTCVRCKIQPQRLAGQGASLGAGGTGLLADEADTETLSTQVSARLLVDCMGSFSPVAAQTRGHAKPDAVCVTVGSCCEGPFPDNGASDLICAIDPILQDRSTQYFWEAFPACKDPAKSTDVGSQMRTTYMFAYGECDASRPSLANTFDDYLRALPRYQRLESVHQLRPKRVLFGFFPAYRNSPLKPAFDRIFHIGDAGGLQSPISFGGFATMLRHLPRLAAGLADALASNDDELLKKSALSKLSAYMPGLSVTWLFNKFMSCRPQQNTIPFLGVYGINRTLFLNMKCMERLGPEVQRPFLQDVVRAGPLTKTLLAMVASDPLLTFKLVPHIGLIDLTQWLSHYFRLILYSLLSNLESDTAPHSEEATAVSPSRFHARRRAESWLYGSGRDHEIG